jgi:hypothetical protein
VEKEKPFSYPLTAMVTAAVTGNSPGFLASLTGPLLVTGGGDMLDGGPSMGGLEGA